MKKLLGIMIFATVSFVFSVQQVMASSEPAVPMIQVSRIDSDLVAIYRYRSGMDAVIRYAQGLPLFQHRDQQGIPRADEKEELRELWGRYLDYVMALDSLIAQYQQYARLDDKTRQGRGYQVFYSAYIAQFRNALDLLQVLEQNPDTHTILNEAVPGLGLGEGSYRAFKYRFLHVQRAAEYAAMTPIVLYYGGFDTYEPWVISDRKALLAYGFGQGTAMTLKNGARLVSDTVRQAIFPVQAGVAEWMGDTKVYRPDDALIDESLVHELQKKLVPGDVMLERREWYVSNVGLPGYWPHAALYIGTAEERDDYFDVPEVITWVKSQGVKSGRVNDWLSRQYPQAYAGAMGKDHHHQVRVIEAISEGVSFTSLEHSAGADSVAVLRPRLSRVAVAQVIGRALSHAGKPYDFDFDFRTDDTLVCTELVFKSYEPLISFSVSRVAGRTVVTANDIARQFDQEQKTGSSPWQFVAFLDGDEKAKTAVWRDESAFRASWPRPKWHIITASMGEVSSTENTSRE